jgi:phosphohistidine phosphatase
MRCAGDKMKIFIMRHGEAASFASEDSQRPLTTKGVLEAKKMGQWLTYCNPALMNIFVSPYCRAQQTCTNVIDALSKAELSTESIVETLDFITPSGNARQFHDYLDGLLQSKNSLIEENNVDDNHAILFISHMPFVSYVVGELTGTSNMPIFSTGTIAVIDYDVKLMRGQLMDMVSPEKVNF